MFGSKICGLNEIRVRIGLGLGLVASNQVVSKHFVGDNLVFLGGVGVVLDALPHHVLESKLHGIQAHPRFLVNGLETRARANIRTKRRTNSKTKTETKTATNKNSC
jgi:hypothetical protein